MNLNRALSILMLSMASLSANAALVTYVGADDDVQSLADMTNSNIAANNFDTATGGLNTFDFESAVPGGLTISGGSITDDSGCGALCGFNVTPGGSSFSLVVGGEITFTFDSPIDSFGFYVTGLQADLVPQQTVTYFDGSSTVFDFPAANDGGGAFIGFTDIGKSIASITLNLTNDIVAIDDIRYGVSSVPVPAAVWLFGSGLVGLVGASRRKKAVAVA
jgi:hypothetical protein